MFDLRQTAWIDVFDGFDQGRGIEAGEFPIGFLERAVTQFHATGMIGPIHTQRESRRGERFGIDVDADDMAELRMRRQSLQQFARAATEIQDTACASVQQAAHHDIQALLV